MDKIYDSDHDSYYCYPDSDVLKNKLGIRNSETLQQAEREITSLRAIQISSSYPEGDFGKAHLKTIHKRLFGDIYKWAGDFRVVNISKGNQLFCLPQFIDEQLDDLLDRLKRENLLAGCASARELAERLAFYLGEINSIHPFREGNGRTQRLFIEQLADRAGYQLDFAKITPDEMLKASIDSFNGDFSLMSDLLERALSNKE